MKDLLEKWRELLRVIMDTNVLQDSQVLFRYILIIGIFKYCFHKILPNVDFVTITYYDPAKSRLLTQLPVGFNVSTELDCGRMVDLHALIWVLGVFLISWYIK